MSVSYSSFRNSLVEPNWAFVERIGSYVDYNERTGEHCALTDRYARKAQESDEDYLYGNTDLMDAYDEGYLLDGMSQDDWDDLCDPFSYHDPVHLGPYLLDQNDYGRFDFQGPQVSLPGPRTPRYPWNPPGFTGEYYCDRSLYSSEECRPHHRTLPR